MEEHGYDFELKKRLQTKSTYAVQKDGLSYDFDVFSTDGKSVASGAEQMKTFERNFEGLVEVIALRQQLKEKSQKCSMDRD